MIKRLILVLLVPIYFIGFVFSFFILSLPYWIILGRYSTNDYFKMVEYIQEKYNLYFSDDSNNNLMY